MMSEQYEPALIRASTLTGISDFLAGQGAAPARLFRDAGLSPQQLDDGQVWLEFSAVVALYSLAGTQLALPDIGRRFCRARDLSALGAVFLASRHAPTLREAILDYGRFTQAQNNFLAITVVPLDATRVALRTTVPDALRQGADHWMEESLLFALRFCREIGGRHAQPLEVHFCHASLANPDSYRADFEARVRFCQPHDQLVLTARAVDQPNPHRNQVLRDLVASHLAALIDTTKPLSERTNTLIDELLPMGKATLEVIAEQLAVHPRALQRSLRAEGFRFSDLLQTRREARAKTLLRTGRFSLVDVAHQVGYADQSAFTHAFTRWTGQTPGEWLVVNSQSPVTQPQYRD